MTGGGRPPGRPTPPRASTARLALLALLPLLSGCLVLPAWTRTRAGALLPEDRVAALRAGTSRREVLDWFGPPTAVVRRGTGPVPIAEVALRASGGEQVPEARFFERFAEQPPGPDDVVYFYRAHQLDTIGTGSAIIVGNAGSLTGSSVDEHREDRLWILLDGASGLVRAHRLERDVPPVPVAPPPPSGQATWGVGGAP